MELAGLESEIFSHPSSCSICEISDTSEDQAMTRNADAVDWSSESVTGPSLWVRPVSSDGFPVISTADTYSQIQLPTEAVLQSNNAAEQQLFHQLQYTESHIPADTVQTSAVIDTTFPIFEQQSVGQRSSFVQFQPIPTLAVEESVSEDYSEPEWQSIPFERGNIINKPESPNDVALFDRGYRESDKLDTSKQSSEYTNSREVDVTNGLDVTSDIVEKELVLDDGMVQKYRSITMKSFTPKCYGKEIAKDSNKYQLLVRIDVNERIMLIPPTVSDTEDPNVRVDERVDYHENVTDTGVPVRTKTTTLIFTAPFIAQEERTVKTENTEAKPVTDLEDTTAEIQTAEVTDQVTLPVSDDFIHSRCEECEEQKKLDDGSTVKRHVTTTTFFKHVKPTAQISEDGAGTGETKAVEEIVRMEIEERIMWLPKDMTDDTVEDTDMKTTVEELEEVTASGIPVKKTVIRKCPVTLPDVPTVVVSDKVLSEEFSQPVSDFVAVEKDKPILMLDMSNEIPTSQTPGEMAVSDTQLSSVGDNLADVTGGIETTRNVTEKESILDDGTIQKIFCTVTKQFRAMVSSEVVAGEAEADKQRILIGIDIDERVMLIPPNISDDPNVTSDESLVYHEDVTTNGVPVRKKTTTVSFASSKMTSDDVSLTPRGESARKTEPTEGEPATIGEIQTVEIIKEVTLPVSEDLIHSRCEEREGQEMLDDGSTTKRHVTITTFFKHVKEDMPSSEDGTGIRETKAVEEIVRMEIEERIIWLPKDVTDDTVGDADMKTTVEELEEVTVSGIPVKKTVITKCPVTLPDVPTLVDSDKVVTEEFSQSVCDLIAIETSEAIVMPDISNEIQTSQRLGEIEVSDTQQSFVGDNQADVTSGLETTSDVTETESVLDDGRIAKIVCTITKQFRPVVSGEVIAGEAEADKERILVGIDIDERVMLIPPHVSSTDDPGITSDESVDYHEKVTNDGVPVRKKTTTVSLSISKMTSDDITLMPRECVVKAETTEAESYIDLQITTSEKQTVKVADQVTLPVSDDLIHTRCEEHEEEEMLDNGNTVKRHVTTTTLFKHVKPYVQSSEDGTNTLETKIVEEIVRMEIEERIMWLPKDMTDGSVKDTDMKTTVEELEEVTASGIPVKKTVIKKCPVSLPDVPTLAVSDEVVSEELSQPISDRIVIEKDKTILTPDISHEIEIERLLEMAVRDTHQPSLSHNPVDVNNGIETTRDVTEQESVLDDGTIQKTVCTVTKQFKCMVSDEVTDGEQEAERDRVLLDIDIDEQITLISPNVCRTDDPNVTRDESVDYHEDVTDGCIPVRKKTTTIIFRASEMTSVDVSLMPSEKRDGEAESTEAEPVAAEELQSVEVMDQVTSPVSKDLIHSRCEEREEQEMLDDGSTVKRHVTTTTFFKHVKPDEQSFDTGTGETKAVDEIVRMEIEELIICLSKDMTDDTVEDTDMKTTVEELEEVTASGIPVKKTIIKKCPVTLPNVPTLAVSDVVVSEELSQPISDRIVIEKDKTILTPDISDEIETERPREMALPDTQQPSVSHNPVDVSNGIETTRDVTEQESVLDDGTIQKTVRTVTKQFRPLVSGEVVAGEAQVDKECILVGIDMDERIMLISPNISDIDDPNVTRNERVEYHENFTDGVPCRKKSTVAEYYLSKMTENVVPVIQHDLVMMQPELDVFEHLDTEYLSPEAVTVSHDGSFNVTEVAGDVSTENVIRVTKCVPEFTVTSKPSVTVKVSRRVRRIGSDGGIEEQFGSSDSLSRRFDSSDDVLRPDDTAVSDVMYYRFLSAADGEDFPGHEFPADSGVQVFAKTVEDEPEVEHDVKEYEDVQEDGTVVRRRVTKTTQKKTIVQQVFIQGDDGAVDDDMTLSRPTIREYTDVSLSGPGEVQSNVEESEEVLDDGSVVRRKVTTTSHQQLVTERHMVAGDTADAPSDSEQLLPDRDSDVGMVPVNGKQSPQSYIPELMKLSGTESDSTKEPGEHSFVCL